MLLDDKCSDLQEEDLYGAVDCWSFRPKTAVFRHLNSWKACSDLQVCFWNAGRSEEGLFTGAEDKASS